MCRPVAEAGYSNTLVVGGRLLLGGLRAQAIAWWTPYWDKWWCCWSSRTDKHVENWTTGQQLTRIRALIVRFVS